MYPSKRIFLIKIRIRKDYALLADLLGFEVFYNTHICGAPNWPGRVVVIYALLQEIDEISIIGLLLKCQCSAVLHIGRKLLGQVLAQFVKGSLKHLCFHICPFFLFGSSW